MSRNAVLDEDKRKGSRGQGRRYRQEGDECIIVNGKERETVCRWMSTWVRVAAMGVRPTLASNLGEGSAFMQVLHERVHVVQVLRQHMLLVFLSSDVLPGGTPAVVAADGAIPSFERTR